MAATVLITGNTYPVREELKKLGGRWDPEAKGWRVAADKAEQANQLVRGAGPVKAGPARVSAGRRNWRPCGYPGCNPRYCDECDGEGYRPGR